jgi:thiamine biosynthesis lipoprotein ApbE
MSALSNPAQGTASVSVMARRTIDGDAWATRFFINGRAWTVTHKPASVFAIDRATGKLAALNHEPRSARVRHQKESFKPS